MAAWREPWSWQTSKRQTYGTYASHERLMISLIYLDGVEVRILGGYIAAGNLESSLCIHTGYP